MTTDFAQTLKSLRSAAGLTLGALARRANVSKSYLGNIERQRRLPSIEVASNLDQALGSGNTLTLIARHSRASGAPLTDHVDTAGGGIDRLFVVAAREAQDELALMASTSDDHDDPMDRLKSLARRYQAEDRISAFTQARELAIHAHHHTICLRRVGQIRDQQVAASLAYALMSSIAFDLLRWRDAIVLARAAAKLAELSGHPGAIGWAHGMQATLENWQGEPTRALRFADAGLANLKSGPARFRLLHIQARSHALQGDRAGVADRLHEAKRVHDRGGHDDVQALGGEFVFGEARAAACAATAWLDAGDASRAEPAARLALELYRANQSDHPASPPSGATIDLVAALLLQERATEAVEQLRRLVGMASAGTAIDGRISRVQAILESPQWNGATRTRELSAVLAAIRGENR